MDKTIKKSKMNSKVIVASLALFLGIVISASWNVSSAQAEAPVIEYFKPNKTSINLGEDVVISTSTKNVDYCVTSGNKEWFKSGMYPNMSGASGSHPTSNPTTYSLECWNSANVSSGKKSFTVTVLGAEIPASSEAPVLEYFKTNKTSINSGELISVSWSVKNADYCVGLGSKEARLGSYYITSTGGIFHPTSTTTYSLECWNSANVSSGEKSFTVTVTGTTPIIQAIAAPTGLKSSCSADGTSVALSWNSVSGADYYPIRVDKSPPSWDGAYWDTVNNCGDGGEMIYNGDHCQNLLASTSKTFKISPDTPYQWWVHASDNSGNWSANPIGTFNCPSSTVTTDTEVDESTSSTDSTPVYGDGSVVSDDPTAYDNSDTAKLVNIRREGYGKVLATYPALSCEIQKKGEENTKTQKAGKPIVGEGPPVYQPCLELDGYYSTGYDWQMIRLQYEAGTAVTLKAVEDAGYTEFSKWTNWYQYDSYKDFPNSCMDKTDLICKFNLDGSNKYEVYTAIFAELPSTPLTITTDSLPSGTVGTPYNNTFLSATGGSGTYSWEVSGQLTGLTTKGKTIYGTPTSAGTYAVTVTVRDGTQSVSKQFSLVIGEEGTTTTSSKCQVSPERGAFSKTTTVTIKCKGVKSVSIKWGDDEGQTINSTSDNIEVLIPYTAKKDATLYVSGSYEKGFWMFKKTDTFSNQYSFTASH